MILFYAATALFAANYLLGVAVQLRLVDSRPFRWLHHALFFLVFASAALAVAVGFWRGEPYRWALVPVLVLYALLPLVRAGTFGHAVLASLALLCYGAALSWVLLF
ncbi:hypothetical protein Rxycam_00119 [Rubrobacter xylanophilus DSM 9941]|uniref:hypothetical protein n=1 Tax=Rubrobacter xylanophilus TaxID=49319 RepID=UPI001C641570|nr:hypothetical protein [Rubrobacter xylanophilus]QYJ14323.1 hypothetical protein Rxycam_00119 [Rubrobacter xylanophilus DSM 9941]